MSALAHYATVIGRNGININAWDYRKTGLSVHVPLILRLIHRDVYIAELMICVFD